MASSLPREKASSTPPSGSRGLRLRTQPGGRAGRARPADQTGPRGPESVGLARDRATSPPPTGCGAAGPTSPFPRTPCTLSWDCGRHCQLLRQARRSGSRRVTSYKCNSNSMGEPVSFEQWVFLCSVTLVFLTCALNPALGGGLRDVPSRLDSVSALWQECLRGDVRAPPPPQEVRRVGPHSRTWTGSARVGSRLPGFSAAQGTDECLELASERVIMRAYSGGRGSHLRRHPLSRQPLPAPLSPACCSSPGQSFPRCLPDGSLLTPGSLHVQEAVPFTQSLTYVAHQ